MRPTLNYVKTKFDEFNKLCFNNSLPEIPIFINKSRTQSGYLKYYIERRPNGERRYFNFSLHISAVLDSDETQIEDTIIHEMIHLYIQWNHIADKSSHGPVFMSMMHDINKRFNRNLSVTKARTKEEMDSDLEIRHHYLCIARLKDGRTGISLPVKTRIFEIWDQILRFKDVESFEWYFSTDPYFNRFRRCKTLKIYIAPAQELSAHLNKARRLVRNGNRIQPAN